MNITPLAEERINQTLDGSELLRIEVNGGGCNGFTVGLMKIAGQEENDIFLIKRGNRSHLGGVFVTGYPRLEK